MSEHDHHAGGSDMKAAFTGLILGAIALLIVLTAVSKLTSSHYASETPAHEAGK
jgi:hypothetical protein